MQVNVSLGPAFVAAFAVQQLLEILTAFLNLEPDSTFEKYKKAILSLVSLVFGLLLAWQLEAVRIFGAVGIGKEHPNLDIIVTGLVLSAGTEGVNSILKFMKYAKEDKKSTAAAKDPAVAGGAAAAVAPGIPTAAALQRMNLK